MSQEIGSKVNFDNPRGFPKAFRAALASYAQDTLTTSYIEALAARHAETSADSWRVLCRANARLASIEVRQRRLERYARKHGLQEEWITVQARVAQEQAAIAEAGYRPEKSLREVLLQSAVMVTRQGNLAG